MNEQSVVSVGSSMDAIGGSLINASFINQLTLAENGILLLEEDETADYIEPAFVEFLRMAGECADGDSVQSIIDAGSVKAAKSSSSSFWDDSEQQSHNTKHLFEFEPDSDDMSWFNPDSWESRRDEEAAGWTPESRTVPCSDDIVAFGHGSIWQSVTGERDKVASFKVNFRPSKASLETEPAGDASRTAQLVGTLEPTRVARLFIGEREYNQQEFDELINSQDYANLLFQFNDSNSAFRQNLWEFSSGGSALIIDETSIASDGNFCIDEAGCLCGNERPEVMKVICSFHEPLRDEDLPCHDPIYSPGYCNKVCATTLTITMDPSLFSERFVSSIIENFLLDNSAAGFNMAVPRRIDYNKYEIIFRYLPYGTNSPGVEREFAQNIVEQLERGKIYNSN